jgi:MFS family permease
MLAILLAAYIFSFVDRHVMSILLQSIKLDLKLTDFQVGLLAGPAFGVSYAIFGLPLGWAADKMPRRWVVFTGIVVWSLATIACGFSRTFFLLFLARAMVGFGEAALTPSAYSLIGDGFPPRRHGTAFSIYAMAPKLGMATAYWATAIAISLTAGLVGMHLPFVGMVKSWHLVFIVIGAVGLPLALLSLTFSEPSRRDLPAKVDSIEPTSLLQYILDHKVLITLLFSGFSIMAVLGGSLVWVPAFVTRVYKLTPVQYGGPIADLQWPHRGPSFQDGNV